MAMPIERPTAEQVLERVVGAAAESVFEASDEEILEDLRLAGEDPVEVAARAEAVMMKAVADHRAGLRRRARQEYEERVATLRQRDDRLPGTEEARLALLALAIHAHPRLRKVLTVQHRDLKGLPDEDVSSYLRQLAALGVLDDLPDE